MGTNCCSSKLESGENGTNYISKILFSKKYVIGRGGFGKVNLTYNNNYY